MSENVNVQLENGSIYGTNGEDACVENKEKNGHHGDHAIIMKSGNLTLRNVSIYGGNAGDAIHIEGGNNLLLMRPAIYITVGMVKRAKSLVNVFFLGFAMMVPTEKMAHK